jgi:RNA polymerase sigma-70 factor, ECF subfamily
LLHIVNSATETTTRAEVLNPVPDLDKFLRQVERRAYRTALLSTKKSADALDIVQEAMLRVVQYYRERSAEELPLLFNRILQNCIVDWHREQANQRRWFWSKKPVENESEAEESDDALNSVADEKNINPAELMLRARDVQRALAVLGDLAFRQRQAFILRAWEGLDVAATASIMGCSEGSVKTHYFRAVQELKRALMQDE